MAKSRAGRGTWNPEQARAQLAKLAQVLGQDAPALASVPFRLEPETSTAPDAVQASLLGNGPAVEDES